jgi:hypothetical protein
VKALREAVKNVDKHPATADASQVAGGGTHVAPPGGITVEVQEVCKDVRS